MRAFSWCPWITGTLNLDSILSLFRCVAPNSEVTYGVVVSCGSSVSGVIVECGGGVVDSKLLDLVLDTRQLQQIVLCKKGDCGHD